MANGQAVLVFTEYLAGGPDAWDLYYVAEPDPAKAEAIIQQAISASPDQKILAKHSIPEEVVKILGLNDARWCHWQSSS